jgi:RNA polymerase sigma factor (sigma-70 family)
MTATRLDRLAAAPADTTDAALLGRFVTSRDEAAFAVLVRRHSPMVLGVCRRVLGCEADAEDACQAVFLLLARRAGAVRTPAAVGGWLHAAAYRLAQKARTQQTRRRARERRAARPAAADAPAAWAELQGVLDGVLAGLPERYRAALVLCYLEGRTQDETARRLGCPLATLRSRVARGRKLLRDRLARRGLSLSGPPW